MQQDSNIILALYPNFRGLGFACVESPQKLLDYGVITIRPICNGPIITRIKKFIEDYRPTLIVTRDNEKLSTRRGRRIAELIEELSKNAAEKNIPVYRYSRSQIKDSFEQFKARSKYEISLKIIEWFSDLAPRAPKIRKRWMDEDYNMGIFDALALAVTHQYLTK